MQPLGEGRARASARREGRARASVRRAPSAPPATHAVPTQLKTSTHAAARKPLYA